MSARSIFAALLAVGVMMVGGVTVRADSTVATPTSPPAMTPEPSATATFTPSPTSTPTVTPRPTATATLQPVADKKSRKRHRRHKRSRAARAAPSSTPTPAPTPTPTAASRTVHGKKYHRNRHAAPDPTPTPTSSATSTPTPTATPPITLNTEDSIKPVTCNGAAKPLTARPFLSSPFAGWTSLVSYFDHDSPNFGRDGEIITATGASAQPDAGHQAADFPAYWNARLRQYLYYDGHNGYDYNIAYQPVYAAAAGRVIFAAYEYSYAPHMGYGQMVMINHGHGYVTLYGHFSKLLVHKGQRVRRGQQIGISGNTGHSTGPHLHFTVFHNCTPTDPYGWYGTGQDPLVGYMGETSMYLWKVAPLITNPPPGWPGLQSVPAVAATRYVLLSLPSTTGGTPGFTRALTRRLTRVQRLLEALGVSAHPDSVLGAVRIEGAISPAALYRLPDVASIGAPDIAEDAGIDVMRALARAALTTRHRRIALNHSHTWSGYLLQWHGRTFLVGRGQKGKAVELRLTHVGKRPTTRIVQADAATGAYALDLGALTPPQIHAVAREISGSFRHRPAVRVRPAHRSTDAPAAARTRGRSSNRGEIAFGFFALVVLAILFVLATPLRKPLLGVFPLSGTGNADANERDDV